METHHTILVTVITCFLNEESYLADAVNSVLEQKYTHWELLLVDDGSVDRSTLIAKTFAGKHPGKIFYIEHPDHQNKGLSASRNLGISKARGSMLCFLDADDVYLSEKISRQLEILYHNPDADMVCEATKYWYDWNEPSHENKIIPIGIEADRLYHPPALLMALYPLGEGEAPCTSSFMVRKTAIDLVGGFEESFSGNKQLYEDQGFFSKMYLNVKIYISSECHSLYRQRKDSLVYSIKRNGHYLEVRKFYLLWFQKYLVQSNVSFPELTYRLKNIIATEGYSRRKWQIPRLKNAFKNLFHLKS